MGNKTIFIVGCGSMARRRLRHIDELMPKASKIVWDIRPDRMAEVSDVFEVRKLDNAAQAADYKPYCMFISVPPASHEQYIDWAIDHNVPFMVEQPISHKVDQLSSIFERVKEKNLTAHISNNHRYSARIRKIKQVIQSGLLGRPLSAMVAAGEYLPDWHSYEPYTDYYPSKKSMGGGLDAVCEIDWLRDLFGEIERINCMAGTYSRLDIDTHDVQQFCMKFKDGPQVSLHIDMLNRHYHAELRIICEEGTIEHRMPDKALRTFSVAKGKKWSSVPLEDDYDNMPSMQGKKHFNFVEPMYREDTKYFLEQLSKNKFDPTSLRSGIENIRIVANLINSIE